MKKINANDLKQIQNNIYDQNLDQLYSAHDNLLEYLEDFKDGPFARGNVHTNEDDLLERAYEDYINMILECNNYRIDGDIYRNYQHFKNDNGTEVGIFNMVLGDYLDSLEDDEYFNIMHQDIDLDDVLNLLDEIKDHIETLEQEQEEEEEGE